MALPQVEKLILYSLGQFYKVINQPLVKKPLTLRTSKITFIEWVLYSGIISKQERALYKNLESLEEKKLIKYDTHIILFTPKGLKELENIEKELKQFKDLEKYFASGDRPKRKLQTTICEGCGK
ncbi:MAG: hypothetical protein V2A62_02710 [Candidatus Woesearchaeota archaeon]